MMTMKDRVGRASDVKLTIGGGACRNLVRSVIGPKLVCATRSRAQNAAIRHVVEKQLNRMTDT